MVEVESLFPTDTETDSEGVAAVESVINDAIMTAGAALASVAEANPVFMAPHDKADALRAIAALEGRAAELKFRILVDAEDVAAEVAARDIGVWSATQLRQRRGDAAADLRLANSLTALPVLAGAMREGRVNVAQAHAVTKAIHALPDTVPSHVLVEAEEYLVEQCATFDALRQAQGPGVRLPSLSRHCPDLIDEEEGKRLADEERRAQAETRLSMKSRGDGTCTLSGRIPDSYAAKLATYLHALTNPRLHDRLDEPREESPFKAAPHLEGHRPWLQKMPFARQAGEAFCQLLDLIDPTRLPAHGGDTATLVVTIDFDTLKKDLGVATLSADVPGDNTGTISAGEARRMACNARIVPVVLGGKSEILDVGRARRFYTGPARRAMIIRDRTCRAEGCDIPGAWCEAHHWTAWVDGGLTDLASGGLLCSFHHHRAHDPDYQIIHLDNGQVRFHHRTDARPRWTPDPSATSTSSGQASSETDMDSGTMETAARLLDDLRAQAPRRPDEWATPTMSIDDDHGIHAIA